ncbi:MAG TPA: BrxA/BrxB family bacilliredoxin [Vicinamibacterales bacterium]
MAYPESFIGPMRQELTRLGVQELRRPEDVDAFVSQKNKTIMIVVNSMCGCAAGKARPGIALALQHPIKPDVVGTVFAGGDVEATERARQYFGAVPPSSPSIAIMRDGELLHFVHRHQIENQNADAIARNLTEAFDRLCGSTA